jgi:hypothetical protein
MHASIADVNLVLLMWRSWDRGRYVLIESVIEVSSGLCAWMWGREWSSGGVLGIA